MSIALVSVLGASQVLAGEASTHPAALRSHAYQILVNELKNESPWIRVHAAEALIRLKHPEPALQVFRPLRETTESPFRIGVWRVLAAGESDAKTRRALVDRIRQAFLDVKGPDQTHAAEALAKLKEPAESDTERTRMKDAVAKNEPSAPYVIWRFAQAGDASAVDQLAALLRSEDNVMRARAAYVLARLQPLPTSAATTISIALTKEPAESSAYVMLRMANGVESIRALASDAKGSTPGRYNGLLALADLKDPQDEALFTQMLSDADPDVRIGGAYGILQLASRPTSAASASPIAK